MIRQVLRAIFWLTIGLQLSPAEAGNEKSPRPKAGEPSAPSSRTAGDALLAKHSCLTCHMVDGKGGCLAPILNGIGARRNLDFIIGRISNAEPDKRKFYDQYTVPELVEHPRVDSQTARKIAGFISTLTASKGVDVAGHGVSVSEDRISSTHVPPDPASIKKGRHLFQQVGCFGCHAIGDIGGQLAPNLDGVGSRRNRASIETLVRAGATHLSTRTGNPVARFKMPPHVLTKQEVLQITDYVLSLPGPEHKNGTRKK